MKKVLVSSLLALFLFGMFAFGVNQTDAYVSVKGYTRKDGTVVKPYVRSNPNGLKSDNYGYTPSQGVYNKTYGTRGTEWDTPTTITDPNYYKGKALYEAGNLTTGSRGNGVISLQNFLISKNIGSASYVTADGNFGKITKKALADYQASVGLTIDGHYGPMTRAYIFAHQ